MSAQIGSLPALPEPWITDYTAKDPAAKNHYAEDQINDHGRACWNAGLNFGLDGAPKDALTDAAPDLLKAAQAFIKYDSDGIHEMDSMILMLMYAEALALAKEAVAKATGAA